MANNSDDCVPQTLTDFVFDLYDSVTVAQLPEEQSRLYNVVLRDLSSKYFATSPWPSPQSIASECNGDPLFLAFYRELTHRHWHAVSRPTLRDRMEGWDVYRELFDELLETAESDLNASQPKLFVNPDWVFDILNEFVYQFQGFCQFRTTLYASANKHHLLGNGEPNPKAPHHVVENVGVLKNVGDVWNVETVYYYLSRMVQIGTSSKVSPSYQYFGIFASVSLSRLECLLGDYTGCLQAMMPIFETDVTVELPKPKLPTDDMSPYEPKTFLEVANSVMLARISLAYHAGIALLMLQRYKDAIAMAGDICSYMQRGFKTGQLRKLPNSDQFFKNYERMLALLALLTHLCPTTLEETVAKAIRDKYGSPKVAELFGGCSPKFISPQHPNFGAAGTSDNPIRHQAKLLESTLEGLEAEKELRSYLKLYTCISVSKLTSFGNDPLLLMSIKLSSRQLEMEDVNKPTTATHKSALDMHFFLEDDEIVHIDEPEKQRRFENYFLAQTLQLYEIRKEANSVDALI